MSDAQRPEPLSRSSLVGFAPWRRDRYNYPMGNLPRRDSTDGEASDAEPEMPRHALGDFETRRVDAVVIALVPEFRQALVRDADGHDYALTRATQGVDLATLQEGQKISCTVTTRLPRVIAATVIL